MLPAVPLPEEEVVVVVLEPVSPPVELPVELPSPVVVPLSAGVELQAARAKAATNVSAIFITDSLCISGSSRTYFPKVRGVKPIIPKGREMFKNKQFLGHLEKAAQRYETWIEARNPGNVAAMRQFMQQMRTQITKAA